MANDEQSGPGDADAKIDEFHVVELLRRIGICLGQPVDATALNLGDVATTDLEDNDFGLLIAGGRQVGIFISELEVVAEDIPGSLVAGFPVIFAEESGDFWLFEGIVGSRIEATHVSDTVETQVIKQSRIKRLFAENPEARCLVAKRELECVAMSSDSHGDGHDDHHDHLPPLQRFIALLRLDQRDIWAVALFALVAGILSLATPLAIESLVNVVSWGTYIQPLIVLGIMLLACLGIAGIMKILQTIVVEIVQRRQLVRIVGDLAHRFPRANQASLSGVYPRELANRVFDIMTIQKASAVLLLDGISIGLTTVMGLLLLAFYHPFLLGFDIVLIICMVSITRLLGRGGVRTAIDESITKYKIAHWLQDILSTPAAFKVNGGEMLAIERANRLTANYLEARKLQFRVVLRQVTFAIGLQVVASTFLLGLGGWLVMKQQLTLGQLVASELVVTVVVGAFAKAGKSLEKFYDLMAGVDKVGHLLDIPVDPRTDLGELPDGPAAVRWDDLDFHFSLTGSTCVVPAYEIKPGSSVAIVGHYRAGKSLLVRSLAGLIRPHHGMAEIAGYDAQTAALGGEGRLVGYACRGEVFHATIEENVDVGRSFVGQKRVRESLDQVGLWDSVLRLPGGTRTMLQSGGSPLSNTQRAQLMIARAIAGNPKLLLIDSLLDDLTPDVRDSLLDKLTGDDVPWTLVIVTNQREIANRADETLELKGH
ncbi:MAG: ABC transporter ATP-binding protein [Aureliella sp.]